MNKYMKGIKVPSWVRWIAVDANGEEWGYAKKPTIEEENIFFSGSWDEGETECMCLCIGDAPKNWKEELYKWDWE